LAATAAAKEVALLLEPVPATTVLAKLLPELSVVAMAMAFVLVPRLQAPELRAGLQIVVLLEVAFCLAQGTLTDIATRLRKAPPWWVAIPLVAGVVLFFPETRIVYHVLRDGSWVVFAGIAWSGAERLREIWTMPGASRAEKLRRRALVGGRIELVLAFAAVAMLIVGVTYFRDTADGGFRALEGYLAWGVAAYFSLTALDVLRVHRPSFLRRPRSLLRYDPLGIEYLAPL